MIENIVEFVGSPFGWAHAVACSNSGGHLFDFRNALPSVQPDGIFRVLRAYRSYCPLLTCVDSDTHSSRDCIERRCWFLGPPWDIYPSEALFTPMCTPGVTDDFALVAVDMSLVFLAVCAELQGA
eukprot:1104716-Pyramimonas_sp.AAC.1